MAFLAPLAEVAAPAIESVLARVGGAAAEDAATNVVSENVPSGRSFSEVLKGINSGGGKPGGSSPKAPDQSVAMAGVASKELGGR